MATSTKQVYDYILKSPENTNGNVLKSFLNDVESGSNLDDFIAGKMSTVTSNVEIVPDFAFSAKSNLETVNLPNATYIGRFAFSSTATAQSVSGEAEEDEDMMFNNKKLKTVNMPVVTNIESYVFDGDENLEITELPDSLVVIKERAFRDCPKVQLTSLPENLVYIGDEAFKNCPEVQLTEFPKNITYIGSEAFNGENIDLSTVPKGLVYIGNGVISEDKMNEYLQQFVENDVLITSSVMPHGLFELGAISGDHGIFENFTIDGIYIPEDISTIGRNLYLYKSSNIKQINIPNNIIIIGSGAFWGCSNLTSLTIPNSITSIGSDAFHGCSSLTSLTIPNSITSIGGSAFYGCNNLTSLTIPNSVTSIGGSAFHGCSSLTSLTIPNSITSIGGSAFYGCNNLTSLTIPNSVTSIGGSAFYGCSSLTNIDLSSVTHAIEIMSHTFNNLPQNAKILFANQEILNEYASATNWSQYASRFEVKNSNE